MAAKKTDVVITHTFKPSETAEAILAMRATLRSMFLWGPPGISKSAVSKQVATSLGIAFIDVRLSQMDPTDLRGIPYPVNVGGVQGVDWSTPLVLPRDLDIRNAQDIEAMPTEIDFYNPKGSNGIHYCTNPQFDVISLTKGLEAKLLKLTPNKAVIALYDADGEIQPGRIAFTVKGKVQGILALEEFNSAPPSVQAAAYQLILDRALGAYEVPEGVYIIAMGNRDTDKGVTFKMPTPIMNRFVHAEMKHDHDDWILWALDEMIHPDVVGFLAAMPDQLFQFNPGTAARGFQTPRSWHFVSDILNQADAMPENVLRGLIIGAVGDAAGLLMMEHRKNAEDMPDPKDVLSGALKTMPKKDVPVSLAYALTTTLCYLLKNQVDEIKMKYNDDKKAAFSSPEFDKWASEADNFLAFILTNFKPEISIMGAKAALAVHKLPFNPTKMKHFNIFSTRYKSFIL